MYPPAIQRLSVYLLILYGYHNYSPVIELNLSQSQICELLCMHRSSMIRIVRYLKQEAIESFSRKKVVIKSHEILLSIAQGDIRPRL